MNIYEWAKIVINFAKEKINIFYRGFFGGSIISGTLLFGGSVNSTTLLFYAYIIKVLAVLIAGLISGFATVLGNDIYHWAKAKLIKRKAKIQKRRTKKAA